MEGYIDLYERVQHIIIKNNGGINYYTDRKEK